MGSSVDMGAGRVVAPQELVRISDAVEDSSILSNPALVPICQDVRNQSKLHLVGLAPKVGFIPI